MQFGIPLCVLFIGCGDDEPEWYGDATFTAAERADVERGAEWLHAQAGLSRPRIAWNYVVTSSEPLPHTIRRGRGPVGESGVAGLCLGSTVYLDPVGGNLDGLAAHELAHCELGFQDGYHASDATTDGIMRVLAPMRWTAAERAQCAEHADRCFTGSAGP